MYLGYGLSRILSMVLDGMPADVLVRATVAEILLGLLGLFALSRYREIGRGQARFATTAA